MNIEPGSLVAGDTVEWTRCAPDTPAPDWVLAYALFNATAAYNFSATADGADHKVTLAPNITAPWQPGRYDWTAFATHTATGKRKVIATGAVLIKLNPQQITLGYNSDQRSHARRVLDAIEAAIQNRATTAQIDLVRGALNGRAIERDPEAMEKLRDKYRAEVAAEERAAAIGRGERVSTSLKVRF